MRWVRMVVGVALLWAFALIGDQITKLLGVAIPGSVIGMAMMWTALETRVIRLAWVEDGSGVLLRWLGLLFVPAAVGFVQFVGAGWLWAKTGGLIAVGALAMLALTAWIAQRGGDAA